MIRSKIRINPENSNRAQNINPNIFSPQRKNILSEVNIVVNRNAIPFDSNPPSIASGLRLGTPSITTRGFDNKGIIKLAHLIIEVLTNYQDMYLKNRIKKDVLELTKNFSLINTDFL